MVSLRPLASLAVSTEQRFWTRRLRWRLRGATQWPAFVVCTLLDGVILHNLPPVSSSGWNLIEGVLIATFANLVLVGALAPFLAKRLARRQVDPAAPMSQAQREVLQDRIATLLLLFGLAAAFVSGLANRPVVVSETEATEEVARQLQAYVAHSGSEELRRNLETANTLRLAEDYFRVCLARDDRRLAACFFVETDREPPRVTRDGDARPNALYRP